MFGTTEHGTVMCRARRIIDAKQVERIANESGWKPPAGVALIFSPTMIECRSPFGHLGHHTGSIAGQPVIWEDGVEALGDEPPPRPDGYTADGTAYWFRNP